MGLDTFGWVEVGESSATDDAVWWNGLLQVHSLYLRNYEVTGMLFGVPKEDVLGFPPIAAGRGVPPDASEEVYQDLGRLTEWYEREGEEELAPKWAALMEPDQNEFGHTWVTWEELATVAWEELAPKPETLKVHVGRNPVEDRNLLTRQDVLKVSSWDWVLSVMRMFAERYDAKYVRLVVWFSW